MGQQAQCHLRFGKTRATGEARFEEKEIVFRGAAAAARKIWLVIPLAEVKSSQAKSGKLEVKFSRGTAVLEIGEAAEKWDYKIKNPRSLLDKLGVKPESRVAALSIDDRAFLSGLRARAGQCSSAVQPGASYDLLFFGASAKEELRRLKELRGSLRSSGALWVIWPKGRKELREDDVRAAALACKLVDVKVASFSETLSALKLMIPRDQR